jgi:hypothetical protein
MNEKIRPPERGLLVGSRKQTIRDSLQPVGFTVSTCRKRFGADSQDTIVYRQHLARIVNKKRRSRMVIVIILLRLRVEPV